MSVIFIHSCDSSKSTQVLFIGNSLTYYHDMPKMLQEMLVKNNINVNIVQVTLPGASLADHLNNEETLKKINGTPWDFIVLQEGTVRILIPEARTYKFQNSVLKIDSMADKLNSKILLYQNYAISIYPERYCYPSILISNNLSADTYCSDSLYNSAEEFKIIETSFLEMSNKINSDVVPIGKYFEACKQNFPELNLFESATDTHPSKLGSYLIASIFFKQLSKDKTNLNFFPAGLTRDEVQKINKLVNMPSN